MTGYQSAPYFYQMVPASAAHPGSRGSMRGIHRIPEHQRGEKSSTKELQTLSRPIRSIVQRFLKQIVRQERGYPTRNIRIGHAKPPQYAEPIPVCLSWGF